MLTQERVRELFEYKDGDLIRKCNKSSAKKGEIAASIDGRYTRARVDGVLIRNHRIVWLYHHGYLPENGVDHIDGNGKNNRIENLREVSQTCNMRNARYNKGKSGIKGIYACRKTGGWQVQIKINRKAHGLGNTRCLLEAACIRLAAEQCISWNLCEANSPAFKYVKENINARGE